MHPAKTLILGIALLIAAGATTAIGHGTSILLQASASVAAVAIALIALSLMSIRWQRQGRVTAATRRAADARTRHLGREADAGINVPAM